MKTYLVVVSLVANGDSKIYAMLVGACSEQEALGVVVERGMKDHPRAIINATYANLITKDMVL